ncbi:MAG: NAD(P)H-dependent oxidoreductase subunit E [Proteobacteria bacterium]|nr:NAD(P)H-dependent oxidoreductase subunit E [Pseudomonadota bacterium]
MDARHLKNRPDDITDNMLTEIDRVIGRYRGQPGSLIPVLQQTQGICGYLPNYVQEYVASGLGVPGSLVFGVVTFYSFFKTVPSGRHSIRVCLGTACFVRGAGEALNRVKRELGIQVGDTTADRRFSLEAVRCLGACGLAPVAVIDDDTYRRMTSDKIMAAVEQYP